MDSSLASNNKINVTDFLVRQSMRMCVTCSNFGWDKCLYGKEEECTKNLIENFPKALKMVLDMFKKSGQSL